MTKQQYTQYRDKIGESNEDFMSIFIRDILSNAPLTLLQRSAVDNIATGSDLWKLPSAMLYENCLEVIGLASEGKYDALITMLKRLPKSEESQQKLFYYIDGKIATKSDYFSADDIKGVRRLKRKLENKRIRKLQSKKFVDMTEDEFRETAYSKTRGGEKLGRELFGIEYSPEKIPKKHIPEVLTPKTDEPMTDPEIYKDIESDEDGLTEAEEFEFNEESKPWKNR